ncbi:MAG: ATP-dependent DNA helicase RecG [Eubacteriales bacterium]|nr:ATP-dependent DNA helicase RecG [Eubacteriales bacterium]
MTLDDHVSTLSGVGDKKARLLGKLGIERVRDLLYYMPRAYETLGVYTVISELKDGMAYSITASIVNEPGLKRINKGLNLVTFTLEDETGRVEAVFFNQPYLKKMYKKGDDVFVSGSIKRIGKRLQFTNPTMEKQGVQHDGSNPVYALTAGLTQKVMRLLVKSALGRYRGNIPEILPNDFRTEHNLAEINFSLLNIHFPEDERALEFAKHRLIFEELLLFNMALLSRETRQQHGGAAFKCETCMKNYFLSKLGYKPTTAQFKVMSEIENDLQKTTPMNRMLQGDVGCGKTTPAFYAMYICVKNGYQCVMMAPTEVLARQHFMTAQRVFSDVDINIELVTGSTAAAQKRTIYENVAGGRTDIVIGTHAVLYDKLQFFNLGLIVTDEHHRFGVGQRARLETKSKAPHTLIMSATPIPRTLALILYGKTDISIIDEMPPGRKPVKTFCVPESKRPGMYAFIENEIASGSQVFVVCPLVEQNDNMDLRSSEEIYKELSARFSTFHVGILHGKMKASEKNEIMRQFKDKELMLLVSTTVIEVGVDVPAATIMVIENAERFGLAQLHQLRGRVGRADKLSYCFLMSGAQQNERLKILTKTNDGFKIAEEDLRLRGPGQFLGSNQSGISDLYMANLIKDMRLVKETRHIANHLFLTDKHLYNQIEIYAKARFLDKFQKTTIN